MESSNDALNNTNDVVKTDDVVNAIKNNDVEYVKNLLDDPNLPTEFLVTGLIPDQTHYVSVTMLYISCFYKVHDIIKLLLDNSSISLDKSTVSMVIDNCYVDILNIFLNHNRIRNEFVTKYKYSDIHIFCTLNDKHNLINTLENTDTDPNLKTFFGTTALDLACKYKHYDLVKLLLEHKNIILNKQSDSDVKSLMSCVTPFYQVCYDGNIEIVKLFIDHPNLCPSREAAILAAAESKSINKYKIIKMLIDDGRFDPNYCGNIVGPLHMACITNDVELFNILINECTTIDINLKKYFNTPLMYACEHGNMNMVKRLLEFENIELHNALYSYCRKSENIDNDLDILRLLMEHPKMTVTELNKAFLFTCSRPYYEHVLKVLLSDDRIDYNVKDMNGSTGLHNACHYNVGSESCIRLLMTKSDINVTAVDDHGNTILHNLCRIQSDYTNVNNSLKYLLEDDRIDSIMEKTNDNDITIMAYLCSSGNYEAVKMILNKYPDYNMSRIDSEGRSYLMHACKSNNLDLIKFLIYEKQNNPLIISRNGMNIFHHVCRQMNLQIIKFVFASQFGIDYNKLCVDKCTPFNYLLCRKDAHNRHISRDNVDTIKYLIDMPFIDHLTPNRINKTPLDYLRENSLGFYSNELVKYILDHDKNEI